MEKISAVIITQNEERNIGRCLESLKGVADEVVVVDSGSTDRTRQICATFNSQFPILNFQFHPWEGYDRQKNYANSLASHPWILSIDADEALSPTLRESLLALKAGSPDSGTVYVFNRLTHYCGRPIHHCGWYPERKARLFRKGNARWDGIVHEDLVFEGGTSLVHGDLLHYPYNCIEDLKAKYDKYASLMAEKYRSQGRRASAVDCILRPSWTFLRNYLFRLGILDGRDGWLICRMSAAYTRLKYTRLRELRK